VAARLSVPACRAVTVRGFTDRHTWIDGVFGPGFVPTLLDADYARKPAWHGLREALLGRPEAVPRGRPDRCRPSSRRGPPHGPPPGWDGRRGPR